MYTPELVQATMEERGRQLARIGRELDAQQVLRRSGTPRSAPSPGQGRRISLVTLLARHLKTALAS